MVHPTCFVDRWEVLQRSQRISDPSRSLCHEIKTKVWRGFIPVCTPKDSHRESRVRKAAHITEEGASAITNLPGRGGNGRREGIAAVISGNEA
jgi:hypothetical protein